MTVGWSIGHVMGEPGGDTAAARLAEWARDHYLAAVVNNLEALQYKLNPPKVGGRPDASALAQLNNPAAQSPPPKVAKVGPVIPMHAALAPVAPGSIPGEGIFRPLVYVNGQPAVQGTYMRPDAVHTSYLDGVVWMSGKLLRYELHPGFADPGNLPQWNQPDWIPPNARTGLVATFNGGFKTPEARGGFYENGHVAGVMVPNAASFVIYKDGHVNIGNWGGEVSMTPDVVAVRQNLYMLIDNGQIAGNLNSNIEASWGLTIGGGYAVWRSGVGITANGDIVQVMGDALTVQSLANLLQRAGAVRAMEMDINPAWMSFMYYTPGTPWPVPHKLVDFQRPADRYYTPTSRDFFAVYAR